VWADPSGELLKQLTRIADALSQPGPSAWMEWLKTIASFVAGLATAYVSQQLQGRLSDGREQKKMRRLVYSELAECFIQLDSMVRVAYQSARPCSFDIRRDLFTFDGESYMKENRAVFYELPEGTVLTWLYEWFHRVRAGERYPRALLKSPLGFFSETYRTNPTIRKYFKQFGGPERFRIIEEAVKQYEHKLSLEDLIDSGMLRVDPATDQEKTSGDTAGES